MNIDTESVTSAVPMGKGEPKKINRSVKCFRCGHYGHLAASCYTDLERRWQPYGKGKGKGKGKGWGGSYGKGKGKGYGKGGPPEGWNNQDWGYPPPPTPVTPPGHLAGLINIYLQGSH